MLPLAIGGVGTALGRISRHDGCLLSLEKAQADADTLHSFVSCGSSWCLFGLDRPAVRWLNVQNT